MPRASSRSSSSEACSSALDSSSSAGRVRVRLHLHPRQLELQGQRHQPRLRAVVQVALEPPPLGVARLHQPRPRGAQLLDPRPQLGLQALVLERQRRRRARRAHELRLLVQRGIVGDRGDPPPLDLDLRPPRARHGHGVPERVHVARGLRQPVGQRQRRVTERVGQRGAQGALARRLAQPRDQLRSPPRPGRAGCAADRRGTRTGSWRRAPARQPVERVLGEPAASNPLATTKAATATPPVHSTGRQARLAAPARSRRMMITQLATTSTTATANCVASRASESAWSPSTISRLRGSSGCSNSSDGSCSTVTVRYAPNDHDPLRARLQPPRRERDQQVAEDRREQPVERDPDREQHVVVGGGHAAREPREPGRGHQRSRAVARPPPPREQAGADERPADQQAEPGGEPAIVDVPAREHDRRVREADREAGQREEDYSPTARFGASPQSCSSR